VLKSRDRGGSLTTGIEEDSNRDRILGCGLGRAMIMVRSGRRWRSFIVVTCTGWKLFFFWDGWWVKHLPNTLDEIGEHGWFI